jgi:hypothetical protein
MKGDSIFAKRSTLNSNHDNIDAFRSRIEEKQGNAMNIVNRGSRKCQSIYQFLYSDNFFCDFIDRSI